MTGVDGLLLILCVFLGGAGAKSWIRSTDVGVGIFAGACALGVALIAVARIVVGTP